MCILNLPSVPIGTPNTGGHLRNKNDAIEWYPGDLESGHLSFEMNIRSCLKVITAGKFQIKVVTVALTHPIRSTYYLIYCKRSYFALRPTWLSSTRSWMECVDCVDNANSVSIPFWEFLKKEALINAKTITTVHFPLITSIWGWL